MTQESEVVRSRANAALKRVGAVRAGREPELLLLEGARLIDDALRVGIALELLLVREDRAAEHAARLAAVPGSRVVARELFGGLSALTTPPGILALARRPAPRSVLQIEIGSDGLALATSGVADPGNLGALARSAEAAGARALLVVGGARPFGEKAVRGSMGSLLRLPVHEAPDVMAAAEGLAELGVRQVRAATRGGVPFDRFDWSGPLVLWMTGEVGDVPSAIAEVEAVTIPTAGEVESLNVTVAASLLLFAAGRVPR